MFLLLFHVSFSLRLGYQCLNSFNLINASSGKENVAEYVWIFNMKKKGVDKLREMRTKYLCIYYLYRMIPYFKIFSKIIDEKCLQVVCVQVNKLTLDLSLMYHYFLIDKLHLRRRNFSMLYNFFYYS